MQLYEFVQQAKDRRIDADTIRRSLARRGWSDEEIDDALLGELTVPLAPGKNASTTTERPLAGHSTSPLFSALHHVLLWFFVGAASFAIVSAVSSLFFEYVSEEALALFIAVSLITFVPYAVVFFLYLKAKRKDPPLAPGRVWSIITICLASIGLMASAITAVVSLIIGSEPAIIVSALCLMLVYGCVIVMYSAAAFLLGTRLKLRAVLLVAPLGLITLLLVGIFVPSLLQLGPAKNDDKLREELVQTVQNIREITEREQALPQNADAQLANPAITYKKLSLSTYEHCAPFGLKASDDTYRTQGPLNDSNVSEYEFQGTVTDKCFTIETSALPADQVIEPDLHN